MLEKRYIMNKKRTFSISKSLLIRLDVLHDSFGINRATFVRMAIYHGLEKIESGYYPYRKKYQRKPEKKKCEIALPEATWEKFRKSMDALRYKLEEHIPDGEMIELFIKIEIKRHENFKNLYIKDESEDVDDWYLFDEKQHITVKADIPNIFYDKIKEQIKETGLKETQINRYILANGLLQECCHTNFTTIDSDRDLLQYIEAIGLDRYKTITLLKNLIQANKILLIMDSDFKRKK